jgi:CCR4-NOT transcription complex subunit 3
MKKIDEGVELFDDIWEKVYSAEQQNQKEKFEMDLKKEIKKLQRHRDQIKTWISGSEVKDKEPLIEARKLIESKMEQFKICEKETKTKTYSKEGLAREDKLDPEDEAKLNTTSWLGEYIEKMTVQVEEKDFEIEKLSTGKGKKNQKHKIEALQKYVLQHKFHTSKLEGIIRLVNNDRLPVDIVDPLQDDLDYYLESYEDEDYAAAYDEEYFYESLGLEELDVVNVDRLTQLTMKKADDATSTSSKSSKERKGSKKSALSSVIPLTIGRARSTKDKLLEEKLTPVKIGRVSSTASSTTSKPELTPPPKPLSGTPPATTPTATPSQPGTSMAAILKRESEQQEKERQQKVRHLGYFCKLNFLRC